MTPRSTIGPIAGVLAVLVLALAPHAQAREAAKFKVLSISGLDSFTHDVVYPSQQYVPTSCTVEMSERITFHSTKRTTAYAFTSKSHGRARVAWSTVPEYTHNFTSVEVPGEMTISRKATYHETSYVDPESGEVYPGCYDTESPVNCAIEKTVPATLSIGGTSGTEESTYVEVLPTPGLGEFDDACYVYAVDPGGDDAGVFPRAALFKKTPKRLAETDRKERQVFDNPTDESTNTGTLVQELTVELQRKKLKRR